jgi:hypothetical protein
MVNSDTGSGGWVELSDERIEVRIERGLFADGQSARQATACPRSVSCCWQNVGRERLGPGSGWWVGGCWQGKASGGEAAQIHVIPHRGGARSLGEIFGRLATRIVNSLVLTQKSWSCSPQRKRPATTCFHVPLHHALYALMLAKRTYNVTKGAWE